MSLFQAIEHGDVNSVRALIQSGVNVNQREPHIGRLSYGQTPLHLAVKQGDVPIVQELLGNGANVNILNLEGEAPLHITSSADIVQLLAKKGADVHILNFQGQSPLHKAAARGNIETATSLISSGANVNLKSTSSGATPLLHAITGGRGTTFPVPQPRPQQAAQPANPGIGPFNPVAAAPIIDNVADGYIIAVNPVDIPILRPGGIGGEPMNREVAIPFNAEWLALAANNLDQFGVEDRDKMVKLLVNKGADISIQDNNGNTPLHEAVTKVETKSAKFLMDHKDAALEAPNAMGNTPLEIINSKGDEGKELKDYLEEKFAGMDLQKILTGNTEKIEANKLLALTVAMNQHYGLPILKPVKSTKKQALNTNQGRKGKLSQ